MKILALLALVPSVLALGGAADAAPSGAQIAKKMAAMNAGYKDSSARLTMRLRDKSGNESVRKMRIKLLERPAASEGDYSLIVFDSPADVRGTALLSHPMVDGDDRQWLYMPAVKRARRIAGGKKSGAFVGSEFTYEDITGAEGAKHHWKLLGEGRCGKTTCYRLETRPRYDGSAYSRRIVWVEKDSYRPVKIEFFGKAGGAVKTLTYGDYRRYKKFWRAHTWTMTNHKSRRQTVLQFDEFKFGSGLGARDFNKSALKRIR